MVNHLVRPDIQGVCHGRVVLMQAIANGEDPRADQRSHVFLMAVLRAGATSFPVRVRNISIHGALLEGNGLPSANQIVALGRGSLSASGQIAWIAGQHCGIRFSKPITVAEWVDRAGPVGQQRIDAAVAEYRRNSSSRAISDYPAITGDPGELGEMSATLLQTCERITELPGMSVELAEELLKIEATAHALREVSRRAHDLG
jgi:hypothetical protein